MERLDKPLSTSVDVLEAIVENAEKKVEKERSEYEDYMLMVWLALAVACFVWWIANHGFFKALLALVFAALFALSEAKNLRRK